MEPLSKPLPAAGRGFEPVRCIIKKLALAESFSGQMPHQMKEWVSSNRFIKPRGKWETQWL